MDMYTSEMDDALACVDALISKIPPEDTAPPLAREAASFANATASCDEARAKREKGRRACFQSERRSRIAPSPFGFRRSNLGHPKRSIVDKISALLKTLSLASSRRSRLVDFVARVEARRTTLSSSWPPSASFPPSGSPL